MLLTKRRFNRPAKHGAPGGAFTGKRGRPMKAPSELIHSRAEKRQQQIFLRNQRATQIEVMQPQISALERLPVEIIQQIFFFCLEPNLANASLFVNRALSHENIYRAVLLFAYFDGHSPFPTEVSLFKPAIFRHIDYHRRFRLQKAIWKCRWCTFDRVRSAMPALSRLAMVQRWHEEKSFEQRGVVADVVERELLVPDPSLADIALLPKINDSEAMKQHFLATTKSKYYLYTRREVRHLAQMENQSHGTDDYLPFISYWSCTRGGNGHIHKTLDGADTVLGVRHFPSRLLEGPWTLENVDFLCLLRQGMRYVSHGHILDISAKALFRGMGVAMTDNRTWRPLITLEFLLELWCHVFGPRQGQNRKKISASYSLPLRLFHLAIEWGPDEIGYMELLTRAGLDSIPSDDAIITGWAVRMKEKGNDIGRWLLEYMLENDSNTNNESLFNNGALSWRRRGESIPFHETPFTEELGYIYERAANAHPIAPSEFPYA